MTTADATARPRRPWRSDLAVTTVLALVVLGPLFTGPGYWLVGDMVFVPHQPWKAAWLGLDGSLPRAVPMDAIVSALTQVVPGSWVQRLFLLGPFLLGGVGIARLVPGLAWYARAAAIAAYCWNPWVHDHLQIGQWAILAGYFSLPWVALAARALRRDLRSGWAPAALALTAAAVCSPSSGVVAVVVLAVLGLRRRLASWVLVAGLAVVANLPWVVPSLLATSGAGSQVSTAGVFAGFAARGESALGVVASLLSLGGSWKTSIVAPERTSVVIVALAGALSIAALLGLRRLRHRDEARRVALLALLALLVAALPASTVGAETLSWLGERVPGTALLRDSHRYLAPAALALALGLAGAVTWARAQLAPGREAWVAVAGLLAVAPLALLPSLAWGASDLRRSTYPADWDRVAERIAAAPPATTVVLPWSGSYRRFAWAQDRAVLDPAPRYLPGEVLVDDRTFLSDLVVASEDPRVARISAALGESSPSEVAAALRALGVRWVLVEKGQGAGAQPAGLVEVDGSALRLIDVGSGGSPSVVENFRSQDYEEMIISGHLLAVLLVCGSTVWILRGGSNDRHV